jgi:hypothetical protein
MIDPDVVRSARALQARARSFVRHVAMERATRSRPCFEDAGEGRQIGLPARLDQRNLHKAFAQAIIAAGTGRCATRCRFPSSYSYRGR